MFVRDPGYADQLARWGVDSLPGAMAFPAQIGPPQVIPRWDRVAGGTKDCCYRLSAAAGESDRQVRSLYLKQYRHNPPAWRYLFRASRANREAANLGALAALGIHCPRVIALGELRQSGSNATKVIFGLLAVALALALAVVAMGLFLWWVGGPKFGKGLTISGGLVAGWSGGGLVAGALFVGLVRALNRDYFVGAALLVTAIEPSEDLWKFAEKRWQRSSAGRPPGPVGAVRQAQIHRLSQQLAAQLAVLHRRRFVHGDLKFRNLLVCWPGGHQPARDNLRIAWIDCPRGRRLIPGPWLTYRRIGDLANLDRNAAPFLSRPQRLRFLRDYLLTVGGRDALKKLDKYARKIAAYHRRRERKQARRRRKQVRARGELQ